MTTIEILKSVKKASRFIATATSVQKNNALISIADFIIKNTDKILEANKVDLAAAKGIISDVMLDRLMLNEERIKSMADGVVALTKLQDPVGVIYDTTVHKNGMKISKVSVPFGVIAIIYESRPNVTSDAAALAIKSGNACVLRSGKEAHNSAGAIVNAICEGLSAVGFPSDLVMLVDDTSRESATELMKANGLVDLLIPRGGKGLIKACVENATVPCIETGTGICHIYIDKSAKMDMAMNILNNAKTSRPSVCNAAEVCLVHRNIIDVAIPMIEEKLVEQRRGESLSPVTLKMDSEALEYSQYGELASDNDFDTEFLDYILAIKVVGSTKEAVNHILEHSTGHSEAIISTDKNDIEYFVKNIDSAAVYVNASTRFTDGGEFGLGCEMGISTQKLHARGPMGLQALTTYKYVIEGNGNIR